ncbi:MAG: pullulanase-type alpha-1,6-glucosidase [Motilibacteraceae bacterium]
MRRSAALARRIVRPVGSSGAARSRPLAAAVATTLLAPLLGVVGVGAQAVGAAAAADPLPGRVTLMGSLQSELGCAKDWDEDCTSTDLPADPAHPGIFSTVFDVPAGSYEYKVRLDGSWDENYGAGGAAGGANIPLVLQGAAQIRVSYDDATHLVTAAPAQAQPGLQPADRALAGTSPRDDLTKERFYFVMADRFENGDPSNDRGGLTGDRLQTGFDPTDSGFYHGGDLAGVTERLDYIKGLGTTAIWLTPSFKDKPVQGAQGQESAGYHGYWITDFTQIDPHLGTNAEMAQLVKAAHAKGMKVFFDIITNHTADVITYDKNAYHAGNLDYVSKADQPYKDAQGNAFDDSAYADGTKGFPQVNEKSFPYQPIVPKGEEHAKTPDWLNDPTLYHNRGVSTFAGESSTYGDFPSGDYSSLDDLWTENPRVVKGMEGIYEQWVKNVGIDGFRIDTVKNVDLAFWQQFSPALRGYAAKLGNDKFFMFGEVYDSNPEVTSQYTTEGKLQATLDFPFQAAGTGFAKGKATTGLRDLYANDNYYNDTDSSAYSLPTFLGNHDMGRIGSFLRQDTGLSEAELLKRDELAHSLMYLTRGQPVVYYGDEQGFSVPADEKDGPGDRRAREDMFPSQVPSYNDNTLIGSSATTAQSNFDTRQPLYRWISQLAALRQANPTLADGAQIHRYASNEAGIYAFSRISPKDRIEYVVAVNNATTAKTATFATFDKRTVYQGVWPAGARHLTTDDEGRITVTVPPLSAVVYKATHPFSDGRTAPHPYFRTPGEGGVVGGRAPISVEVPGNAFDQATIAWRPVGTSDWTVLGTDDSAPYGVYQDVSGLAKGTLVEYRAVVKDQDGDLGVASTYATVGDAPKPVTGGGDGPVVEPTSVTVAGDLDPKLGCPDVWQPECAAAHLEYDATSKVWSKTFDIPAGTYAYKAALNGSWDENYGANAARNGANIELKAPGGPVTFYYSSATHWITDSVAMPKPFVVAGDFQSEVGCSDDWQPSCLASWLQDPDGDGAWTYRTGPLPAGSYNAKVAVGLSWDENYGADGAPGGANIPFEVQAGQGAQFSYDPASHQLTITPYAAGGAGAPAPDLSQQKAQWVSRDTVAWKLPSAAEPGWTYRLYSSEDAGLGLDAEAVTGGTSVPLTVDPAGLDGALTAKYPQVAGYQALHLRGEDLRKVPDLLTGQLAVAAFDDDGRLVDATGVQIPGVLDDTYPGAASRSLGVTWHGRVPAVALWAPTAQSVDLLVHRGEGQPQRVAMRRDRDGVWNAVGRPDWKGASYLFAVKVFAPSVGKVVTNQVTDPYSLALTTDSARSVFVDLDDPALAPAGWDHLAKPALKQGEDSTIYELHVRDFSIADKTVPARLRGTYLAFTQQDSDGMKHLAELAKAGLNTVHLLPTFDIATIEERRGQQAEPACDLASYEPSSDQQQACVGAVRDQDGYNWGYDPLHYTTPEGSYATDPEGPQRTLEYRQMVQALNRTGLRVVNDVVFNHTAASGEDPKSVLDQVVPGYYQRLDAKGTVETSTCCANTATEHRMMEKLMIDSVVTWATEYKVDGFRFDLMGHQPKQAMLDLRTALDALTVRKDGVDGKSIYLYGEGWNFGEVADDALFVQATQANMAGTGIGTFNDRIRDAVRGGSPFDADPRIQGFASGLYTQPNSSPANGDQAAQKARLLLYQDQIKVGLSGNLKDYSFVDRTGKTVKGSEVDYNGSPTGYADDPSDTINYVDAHDNETLFDALTYKLSDKVSEADRGRMATVALATTALSQGVSFWQAGTDLLRSKSLDGNSYDSGDWYNELDWSGATNGFAKGLPPAWANSAKWDYQRPLLADAALEPEPSVIAAAGARADQLLEIRQSSPLFHLGSAALIQQRLSFPDGGPDQQAGVITMRLSDMVGADLDPRWKDVVVVFNARPGSATVTVPGAAEHYVLHPAQADGADPVVEQATAVGGTFTVPARTVAVFVAPQG